MLSNQIPQLKETLDGWDEQLIVTGTNLIRKRREFLAVIGNLMEEIHGKLTGGKEEMKVSYDPNIEEKDFRRQLYERRDRDIKKGTSSFLINSFVNLEKKKK